MPQERHYPFHLQNQCQSLKCLRFLPATGAEDSAVLPAVIAPPEEQAAKLKTIAHDNATETTFLISEPP